MMGRAYLSLTAGLSIVLALGAAAQSPVPWLPQQSRTTERLRAVSAVNTDVAWASGNKGTVLRTRTGGFLIVVAQGNRSAMTMVRPGEIGWMRVGPPGSEALDFRDIEAFDATTATVLSIGPGDKSRIYRTTDGGSTWALQFTNADPKAFYDAIAFWDKNNGLAFGDPVDGHFTVIRTADGGKTWTAVPPANLPPALEGEGAFAASGTCLTVQGKSNAWFATGGAARARVFRSSDRGLTWRVADTPIVAGTASAGVFSVAFSDANNGVVVGGDYRKEQDPSDNLAFTADGGATWRTLGSTRLWNFRSAVAYVPDSKGRSLIAVGPAGADRSDDGGANWRPLGDQGFHAFSIARGDQDFRTTHERSFFIARASHAAWAVGEQGKIARLIDELVARQAK